MKNTFDAFRELHLRDAAFVLPNAWDAASARLMERAGAAAVGTTSAGIAASLGWPDNERLPAEAFIAAVAGMARVVDLPLSVDIETGYFREPVAFRDFIRRLLDLGIAGVNIQDASGVDAELMDTAETCRRIKWIAATGERCACPVFINARTDIFWIDSGLNDEQRMRIAVQRLDAFRNAGADGGFLPGLGDLGTVARIADELGNNFPINILARPGLPDVHALGRHGVKRVSTGSGVFRWLYGQVRGIAESSVRDANFEWLHDTGIDYADLQALF